MMIKPLKPFNELKKTSANIEQQIQASKKTEAQIAQFRQHFMPVAQRAALLYFCASDFSVIDPMYQFSLKWFVDLFKLAISKSERPADSQQLIASFQLSVARNFYQLTSYSLFSRHKILFSTLLAVRILFSDEQISSSELAFLLQPIPSEEKNPFDWLSQDIWIYLASLPSVSTSFQNLVSSLRNNPEKWQAYLKLTTPEQEKIPLEAKLTPFQRLLLLRVFHLHRVREGLRAFISETLGREFIEPPGLNLGKIFKESSPFITFNFHYYSRY